MTNKDRLVQTDAPKVFTDAEAARQWQAARDDEFKRKIRSLLKPASKPKGR